MSVFKSFTPCKSYNVVLIGDSRVGKSTFIDHLQKQLTNTVEDPYRGTVLPDTKILYYYDEPRDENIVLQILDTPGLDEKPVDGVARPNEQLQDLISGHIKENFSAVNLILITIQRKGITENMMKSIYQVKEYFGNKYLGNMCLLITHCDSCTEEEEQTLLELLVKNREMGDFIKAIGGRVLFTGKNSKDVEAVKNLDFVEEQTRRKERFIELVLGSIKMSLKRNVDLKNLRPIDILESAAVTNTTILNLPAENKKELDSLQSLLHKLKGLNLQGVTKKVKNTDGEETERDQEEVKNNIINQISEFIDSLSVVEVTPEEREEAKRYNDAEIPLKEKAEELKELNFNLKTQRNLTETIYNRLNLLVPVQTTPKKEKQRSSFINMD